MQIKGQAPYLCLDDKHGTKQALAATSGSGTIDGEEQLSRTGGPYSDELGMTRSKEGLLSYSSLRHAPSHSSLAHMEARCHADDAETPCGVFKLTFMLFSSPRGWGRARDNGNPRLSLVSDCSVSLDGELHANCIAHDGVTIKLQQQ